VQLGNFARDAGAAIAENLPGVGKHSPRHGAELVKDDRAVLDAQAFEGRGAVHRSARAKSRRREFFVR